jgi:hypothetical protein
VVQTPQSAAEAALTLPSGKAVRPRPQDPTACSTAGSKRARVPRLERQY